MPIPKGSAKTGDKEVETLLGRNNLDFLLSGAKIADHKLQTNLPESLLESAVRALDGIAPSELLARKGELLRLGPVEFFVGELARYRLEGAIALNHLNNILASKVASENPGSMVKTYLKLDAVCKDGNGGERLASVLLSLDDDLKRFVRVYGENFVDIDNSSVAKGVEIYLYTHKLKPSSLAYSHLEEKIKGSKVLCDGVYAELVPVSTVRMVVKDIKEDEKRNVEEKIIKRMAEYARAKGLAAGKGSLKGRIREDLEKALNVGESGYQDLYSAFEHTRFCVTVLEDIIRATKPQDLKVLKFFELANGASERNGRKRKGNVHRLDDKLAKSLRKEAVDLLEKAIAETIAVPYGVFEYGTKKPESLADKVLLNMLFETIRKGFADSSLNSYLAARGLPPLTEKDVKFRRDLRDLHRMSWVIHGGSVTYDLRHGNIKDYKTSLPVSEELALSHVYDEFFRFAGVPDVERGYVLSEKGKEVPKWRQLPPTLTPSRVIINFPNPADVKDYITDRKSSGYGAMKAFAVYDGAGSPLPFEIQMTTNFMDTLNRLDKDAQHDLFKAKNAALIDYCVEEGAITQREIAAIRFLMTEALGR